MKRLSAEPSIVVLHVMTASSYGGLELYVRDLILQMQLAGIQQVVYAMPNSPFYNDLLASKVELIPAYQRKKFSYQDWKRLRSVIREKNISHVHAHTNIDVWMCSMALIGKKFPALCFSLYMGTTRKRDLIHALIYSKISALVSSSSYTNQTVVEHYGIAKHKIHLLRYGRDLSLYQNNPTDSEKLRSEFQVDDSVLLFGTLARVDEQKGLRELVLAIAALPIEYKQKVKLWLIGDRAIESVLPDGRKLYEKSSEELYHWIQQYIQENALEQCIQMIPFQREYIRYVDAMDVFVLASWNEMYSLSVIDAMLMEKPIIGTHAGGTTEQIGIQERGILAEPKSVESLQKAILFMINNPEQRKEMAQNAKEWAIEEHTWPLVIDRWKSLYQETI